MMPSSSPPVVVELPLRGERWVAIVSPGDRVPSHGTDILGQRFAYDFVRIDERPGLHQHPASLLRWSVLGASTREHHAWGAHVHAPFDGEIVAAVDGVSERGWVLPGVEALRALANGMTFRPSRPLRAKGVPCAFRSYEVLRDCAWQPVTDGVPRRADVIRHLGG